MNKPAAGFTLIEMVVAITMIGVLAAVIGVILRPPIESYVATRNRAYLSLTATSAISQITRDIRSALPNSVRMPAGSTNCIEMLPTNGGGRYRANPQTDGALGNPIDFSVPTSQFDVLAGDVSKAGKGDLVAIYNLGIPGADAYAGDNTAVISTVAAGLITLLPSKQFSTDSPGQRFFTLPAASSFYLCVGAGLSSGEGTGTLYQYSNALAGALATCPTTAPGNAAVVARDVSSCSFSYVSGTNTRTGIVTMTLGLTKSSETIQLYREAHVSNAP